MPMSSEGMASVAAVTRSQLSQPAPAVTKSELPASHSEPDADSDEQETAPASDLSHF